MYAKWWQSAITIKVENMIRIICTECKNAYLQKEGNVLTCPSCKAEIPEEKENLITGIQYYNEGSFDKAKDCLMKYIVQNGADPEAIFYKALCDGFDFDEDTNSLKSTYLKIAEAFEDFESDSIPHYLALANDEMAKLEQFVAEKHIRMFEDADAEKIKKEVTTIINIQNDAKAFRTALTAIADKYNEQSVANQISVNFSKCFLVHPEIASEVGVLKFNKITDNIASHTVFTGILSTEIKNLEIYYRCIVMFFERNRQKYDFLMASAEKFSELDKLLAEGQYNTIKGTATIGDKLKSAAYDFFQESLKDHDDDFDTNEETVKIIETNVEEEPEEKEEVLEDISSVSTDDVQAEPTEAPAQAEEFEDISSDSEEAIEEIAEAEEIVEEANEEVIEAPEVEEAIEEVVEEATEEVVVVEETPSEPSQEAEEAPSQERTAKEEVQDAINSAKAAKLAALSEKAEPAEALVKTEEIIEVESQDPQPAQEEEIKDDTPSKPRRKKSFAPIITGIVIILGILVLIGFTVVPDKINETKYDKAVALADSGDFGKAADVFAELGDYEDSETKAQDCKYSFAQSLEVAKEFESARDVYKSLGDFKDSKAKVDSCTYNHALTKLDAGEYDKALAIFESIPEYADSAVRIEECKYNKALALCEAKQYVDAIDILSSLEKYPDAKEKTLEAKYSYVKENPKKDDAKTLEFLNDLAKEGYKDSVDIRNSLLGTKTKKVSFCINYSKTDTKTNLKAVENTKPIYFHVVVNDAKLYNKKLTIQYTTSMGYTEKKSIVLTKGKKTYAMYYPSTRDQGYTVKFKLVGSDKSTLASQTVTIK